MVGAHERATAPSGVRTSAPMLAILGRGGMQAPLAVAGMASLYDRASKRALRPRRQVRSHASCLALALDWH